LFCPQCGALNRDDATVCATCAAPLPRQAQAGTYEVRPSSGVQCQHCGMINPSDAARCGNCGQSLQGTGRLGTPSNEKVPNHLIFSILVTFCCCMPIGVAAIIFSAQVNGKLEAGNVEGAREASKNALMLCWLSFGLGLIVNLGYLLIYVLGALSALQEGVY
jgi:ribosomal protein L40E